MTPNSPNAERLVPVTSADPAGPRSSVDMLASMCQGQEESLAVLRHILAALGASGSIPSVELAVDSKGQVKPQVKVYDLDPERANQEAQRIFDELVIKYTPDQKS